MDLFGDLAGLHVGFANLGEDADGDVSIDAACGGDEGYDGQCNQTYLPNCYESDYKPHNESAYVV